MILGTIYWHDLTLTGAEKALLLFCFLLWLWQDWKHEKQLKKEKTELQARLDALAQRIEELENV